MGERKRGLLMVAVVLSIISSLLPGALAMCTPEACLADEPDKCKRFKCNRRGECKLRARGKKCPAGQTCNPEDGQCKTSQCVVACDDQQAPNACKANKCKKAGGCRRIPAPMAPEGCCEKKRHCRGSADGEKCIISSGDAFGFCGTPAPQCNASNCQSDGCITRECVEGECTDVANEGPDCCLANADCEDPDLSICNRAEGDDRGTCVRCTADADCNTDNNLFTCVDNMCTTRPNECDEPCESTGCTTRECVFGECGDTAVDAAPGCCEADNQCAEQSLDTPICNIASGADRGTCVRCTADADCNTDNSNLFTCVDNECTASPTSEASPDPANQCNASNCQSDSCITRECVEGECTDTANEGPDCCLDDDDCEDPDFSICNRSPGDDRGTCVHCTQDADCNGGIDVGIRCIDNLCTAFSMSETSPGAP